MYNTNTGTNTDENIKSLTLNQKMFNKENTFKIDNICNISIYSHELDINNITQNILISDNAQVLNGFNTLLEYHVIQYGITKIQAIQINIHHNFNYHILNELAMYYQINGILTFIDFKHQTLWILIINNTNWNSQLNKKPAYNRLSKINQNITTHICNTCNIGN